jgi:hypothetical protein
MSGAPNSRSISLRAGALARPAADSNCAAREESAGRAVGAEGAEGALGAAVAHAEISSKAAREAMNRMPQTMPPKCRARNACATGARAL